MILYIYIYILVSSYRHSDRNEHTRILAVRYLLQTCTVVEQWFNLYRAACASEISTYFVIYIGKHFFLQNIRIREDAILNIRICGCQKYDILSITTTEYIYRY